MNESSIENIINVVNEIEGNKDWETSIGDNYVKLFREYGENGAKNHCSIFIEPDGSFYQCVHRMNIPGKRSYQYRPVLVGEHFKLPKFKFFEERIYSKIENTLNKLGEWLILEEREQRMKKYLSQRERFKFLKLFEEKAYPKIEHMLKRLEVWFMFEKKEQRLKKYVENIEKQFDYLSQKNKGHAPLSAEELRIEMYRMYIMQSLNCP
jgi:hypothetical protein